MSSSGAAYIRQLETEVNVADYGNVNVVDATAAINAAMAVAANPVSISGARGHDGTYGPANRTLYFPAGVWNWNAITSIVAPRNVSIKMSNGAVIRANSAIPGPLLDTDSLAWEGQSIFGGGTLDCNLLAQHGSRVRLGRYSSISDIRIDDPLQHGVILGDVGLSASSFEMHLSNVRVRRRTGLPIVAGARGFSIEKCSDSTLMACVGIGFETGFFDQSGDNRKISCHAWGYAGSFISYGFDDASGSMSSYIACSSDSPTIAGFRLRVGYVEMTSCKVFLSSTQTDNTVIGVSLDAGASNLTAINNRIQGYSAGVRLAADYKGADNGWLATSTVVGPPAAFTVSPLPKANAFAPYSITGEVLEKTYYLPGTVAASNLPLQVFWSVPVQADTCVIRAGSGSGTQFQIWQGGTQLTPTFNLGDLAVLNNPFNSGVPVTLAANAGLYIVVVTAGTGSNFTFNFKAFKNG